MSSQQSEQTVYTPLCSTGVAWYHYDEDCLKVKGDLRERQWRYIEYHNLDSCEVCVDE